MPRYIVLEEAMATETCLVQETNVHELLIENPGPQDLFIQAGDFVKCGRLERAFGADFIVPAKSGQVPLPAFCVESARRHRRYREPVPHLAKSSDFASSKKLRVALHPSKSQDPAGNSGPALQEKLSAPHGAKGGRAESATSLQLSYEFAETTAALHDYLTRLEKAPTPGASGVIWAINGNFSHADIYGDAALFRKVWKKLHRAAALEAIGARNLPDSAWSMDVATVSGWVEAARAAWVEQEFLPPRTHIFTHRAKSQLRVETHDTAVAGSIHLSILALPGGGEGVQV